jgi:hypothetical protein
MNEILEWLAGLDPEFAFLLALPFAIGALGLLAGRLQAPRGRDATAPERSDAQRREHRSRLRTTRA